MPLAKSPLTRDRILATAEDVIRRFGPAKATVVDVARALGVSHAAVYRHVATKAELRDLVVGRWVEATMLRERLATETVDLLYLDHPFKSDLNYNVRFS